MAHVDPCPWSPTISLAQVDDRRISLSRAGLAERQVIGARLAVILIGIATYPYLTAEMHFNNLVAYALLGMFFVYGSFVVYIARSTTTRTTLVSAVLTTIDGAFLTLWLAVTGGFSSPYFIAYYLGVAGSALRFSFRTLISVAAMYALFYVGMVWWLSQLEGHALELGIRCAYLLLAAVISGLISRESIAAAKHKSTAEHAIRESTQRELWLKTSREELEVEVARRTVELEMANGALRDEVGRRQQAQAALAAAKDLADRASQSKSAFLAAMSHEIRTPLGAVMGFVELLGESGHGPEERRSYMDVIRRNSEMLGHIVSDILDLSKIEAGRLEIETLPVKLRDLLQDVSSSLQPEARRKGLSLTVHVDQSLPERINSDPTRLRQILMNLAANAIKFTSKGGVTIMAQSQGGDLLLQVEDTGAGLTEEQQARLFQPFGQADCSTTRTHGGTGLGLALSRHLAEAMGGELNLAHSRPLAGSSFIVRLPLDAANNLSALSQPEPVEQELAGLKILVVDDTADNLLLIRTMLTKAGAIIEFAINGEEAVSEGMKLNHDLIMMDLQMPVMDGFEATRRLRAQGYRQPIIALSAHALQHQRHVSLAAGCNEHLTKPVDRQLLINTIRAHVGPPPS